VITDFPRPPSPSPPKTRENQCARVSCFITERLQKPTISLVVMFSLLIPYCPIQTILLAVIHHHLSLHLQKAIIIWRRRKESLHFSLLIVIAWHLSICLFCFFCPQLTISSSLLTLFVNQVNRIQGGEY
jgi:hypothetical protein